MCINPIALELNVLFINPRMAEWGRQNVFFCVIINSKNIAIVHMALMAEGGGFSQNFSTRSVGVYN